MTFGFRPNATAILTKSILSLIFLGLISDFRQMTLINRDATFKVLHWVHFTFTDFHIHYRKYYGAWQRPKHGKIASTY